MRPPFGLAARRVFIDTSAFFGLADVDDSYCSTAQALHARLIAEHWHTFTSNFVVAETHALMLTRLGRAVATTILQEIDRSATTVVRVSAADERRAREIIAQYDDKDFSLTDATSFAIMERLRMTYAFTFDRDFTQYGFITLAPGQV